MPPRRRRYSHRRIPRPLGKRNKYSNETVSTVINTNLVAGQGAGVTSAAIVVPSFASNGVRKVKNFSVNLSLYSSNFEFYPFSWALIFVPEGHNTPTLVNGNAAGVASLYEPSSAIIASGSGTTDSAMRCFSRLARNLNSGDTIQFCFIPLKNASQNDLLSMSLVVNYAICFS